MTSQKFGTRYIPFLAVLVLAAGCSGNGLGSAPPATMQAAASWMSPDAKKSDLLYVSDLGTNDVDVYTYPQGKLVGTLSGFEAVHSGCVDAHGNVFITSSHNSKIIEFAHGGTSPIATLDDGGYGPVGCSVDPKTGDLAVANISPVYGSNPGNIALYKHAKGSATYYTDASVFLYYDCAYDGHGNLYVSGGNEQGMFEFAEIPKGSQDFTNISLSQQINVPGGVQWDGKYVAVEDQGAGYHGSTVYQFSINGSRGYKVGTTALTGSADVIQFWIAHHKIIGPNIGSSPNVMFWKYPIGGTALKTITGFTQPVGVTVSPGE